jgi:Oligogalacturonate lyase
MMTNLRSCALPASLLIPLALAARGETLAAFDGRCIPAGCVAPPSNTPGILGRRALPAGRLARLGATPDFHHGLLGAPKPASIPGEGGLFIAPPAAQAPATEPPREWIDPDTGHRVVRLSDEPGSQSLYFHQNAYTPDGAKLIITTPTGLSTIDLKTRAIERVVEGRVNLIMTGRKTGHAYYVRMGTVYAVDLDTKVSREVARLPPRGSIATVNADETLLAGTITEGTVPGASAAQGRDNYPGKGSMMERRLAARLPMQMFVLDVMTAETRTILRSTDWLNHLQFSPTDPTLLLFCHEGPWHKVDRTWTIQTDGTRVVPNRPSLATSTRRAQIT